MNENTSEGWYDPDATTFGDRVAGAREQAGMTQVEMAKRLGVKMKTLKAWEDDCSEPRANKLSMMAGLLNVSLMWLINGKGDAPRAPGHDGEMPPEISDMMTEFRGLRAQLLQTTERLRQLENNLRRALTEQTGE